MDNQGIVLGFLNSRCKSPNSGRIGETLSSLYPNQGNLECRTIEEGKIFLYQNYGHVQHHVTIHHNPLNPKSKLDYIGFICRYKYIHRQQTSLQNSFNKSEQLCNQYIKSMFQMIAKDLQTRRHRPWYHCAEMHTASNFG